MKEILKILIEEDTECKDAQRFSLIVLNDEDLISHGGFYKKEYLIKELSNELKYLIKEQTL